MNKKIRSEQQSRHKRAQSSAKAALTFPPYHLSTHPDFLDGKSILSDLCTEGSGGESMPANLHTQLAQPLDARDDLRDVRPSSRCPIFLILTCVPCCRTPKHHLSTRQLIHGPENICETRPPKLGTRRNTCRAAKLLRIFFPAGLYVCRGMRSGGVA